MSAYYNEIEPYAVDWLKNLIAAGHIAPGDVDDRSIEDVHPDDLRGYVQCHFFAGIGVWSHALRRAGWPDDRHVWTGSCPCQPFSAAGKGGGFADERHLWPAWFHLIRERRPGTIFGEQVASQDGLGWLDLVQADLEGEGYALGPTDVCAAGVGAPEIRQRLWLVGERLGHHHHQGLEGRPSTGECEGERAVGSTGLVLGRLAHHHHHHQCERPAGNPSWASNLARNVEAGRLALPDDAQRWPDPTGGDHARGADAGRPQGAGDAKRRRSVEWVADTRCERGARGGDVGDVGDAPTGDQSPREERQWLWNAAHDRVAIGRVEGTRQVDGFWRAADWLLCRDPGGPRWRPVEPGTFPLADGSPARMGRLRAYGNAIVAENAVAVIRAYMEHHADETVALYA